MSGSLLQGSAVGEKAAAQTPVDGWTLSYEYFSGVCSWSHPDFPNGRLAATWEWADDGMIACEWQTNDGDVFPLDDIALAPTGDADTDATAYIAAIRPILAARLAPNV